MGQASDTAGVLEVSEWECKTTVTDRRRAAGEDGLALGAEGWKL